MTVRFDATDHELAVSVDHVTQRFSLRHEKTMKGLLVNTLTGRHPSTETFLALDDVNLQIPAGTTMGLIGHNGSGKSTLLKIIGGVLTPTEGQVTRRGRLAALLELGAGFHRDLSGRENVYLNAEILGLSRADIASKFDDIVEFSGVEQFIDTPMKFYSSGMFVRLGFSVAIHTEPDVLLVDEVLAVGDEQFKAKCLDVIRTFQAQGRTIVLVTHSMDQVVEFCDRAALLHHGVVRSLGAPADAIAMFRKLIAEDAQAAKEAKEAKEARAASGASHPDAGAAKGAPRGAARAASPAKPPPASALKVVRVSASTEPNRPLNAVRPGDTLTVDATFEGSAQQPFVGRVELYSGGQLLHGTSTDRLGVEPDLSMRQHSYRFVLPDLPLAGGRYRVAVSIAPDRHSPAVHAIPAAVRFTIPGEPERVGPVAIRPTIQSLDAADT